MHRLEDVASVLHVANRDFFEEAVGIELLRVGRSQDVSIKIAARDGFFKDRRIRGHAPQAVVFNIPFQLSAGEQVSANVIHPGGLSVGEQPLQWVCSLAGTYARDRRRCRHTGSPSFRKGFETLLYASAAWARFSLRIPIVFLTVSSPLQTLLPALSLFPAAARAVLRS